MKTWLTCTQHVACVVESRDLGEQLAEVLDMSPGFFEVHHPAGGQPDSPAERLAKARADLEEMIATLSQGEARGILNDARDQAGALLEEAGQELAHARAELEVARAEARAELDTLEARRSRRGLVRRIFRKNK